MTYGASDLTDYKKLQLEFWTLFKNYLVLSDSPVKPRKPYPSHYTMYAIGRTDFVLLAYIEIKKEMIGVGLEMSGPHAKHHYFLLLRDRASIEKELGTSLRWLELEKHERSQILKEIWGKNLYDRQPWPEMFDWMKTNLDQFHSVLGSKIRQLRA